MVFVYFSFSRHIFCSAHALFVVLVLVAFGLARGYQQQQQQQQSAFHHHHHPSRYLLSMTRRLWCD
jgi:hypothetical protein